MRTLPYTFERTVDQFDAIIKALKEGDPVLAREKMDEHLDLVRYALGKEKGHVKNNLVHCKQGELNSSKHSVVLQRIDGGVNLRIVSHPVLQEIEDVKWVEITVDGRKIRAREGEKIAAAMLAANIRIARYTSVRSEPRGLFLWDWAV